MQYSEYHSRSLFKRLLFVLTFTALPVAADQISGESNNIQLPGLSSPKSLLITGEVGSPLGQKVAGLGDFDGDGMPDLLVFSSRECFIIYGERGEGLYGEASVDESAFETASLRIERALVLKIQTE